MHELPEYLLSRGQHSATAEEIAELVGWQLASVRSGLARLRSQRRVFSPARGLYVMIPPEYRSWGVVPAANFIDEMMHYLGRGYYVALLSAAAMHGASHQAPMAFQAMTDARVADREIGRVRLRFYVSRRLATMPTTTRNTPTGTVTVSTLEATVVDLVQHPRSSGGLSNIATILREIGSLDGDELARISALRPRAHARRLGWMLQRFSPDTDLAALRAHARAGTGPPSTLSPSGPRRGPVDPEWSVWVNTAVEPDVP